MDIHSNLANSLMTRLIGLPGISKIGGLVRTLETTERVEDGKPVRYPVTQDAILSSGPALGATQYMDLVPNSRESGILYAEDYGLTVLDTDRIGIKLQSRLRVVGILNKELIPTENTELAVQVGILSRLIIPTYNNGFLTRVTSKAGPVLTVENKLFSRYTYSSTTVQFDLAPFFTFGQDIVTEFVVALNCLPV